MRGAPGAEPSWRARNRRGARGTVVARAESSWRAGCFVAPLRGGWLDGDVWSCVVRPPKWCAHAWEILVTARGMERAPLARSALADSAVGVLIVVDESPARGGGDEGCSLDSGRCWLEGSRCLAFMKADEFAAVLLR